MAAVERPNISVKIQPRAVDRSTGSHHAYPTTSPAHTPRAFGVRGSDPMRLPHQGRLRDLSHLSRRLQAPTARLPVVGVERESAKGLLSRAPRGAGVWRVRPDAVRREHPGDG